jgi:ATP-dependent RNA helicase DeaD
MDLDELFSIEATFESLGLSPELRQSLAAIQITRPTRVQAELIPHVLAGRDVLGQSKTGTGKTLAFGLPMLQMIRPEESLVGLCWFRRANWRCR